MAWTLTGTYFEDCSCVTICPCTWSGMTTLTTPGRDGPVQLGNVFHPANTTLTMSPATHSRADAFGIRFDGTGGGHSQAKGFGAHG